MTAAVFQSALTRLIVEPGFRQRVEQRGDTALPAELSALERQRLLAVAADPGLRITRTLHQGFRLGKLLAQLPLTFTLLDDATSSREVDDFWAARRPRGFYYLEEAVAFCDHLLARADELEVPFLGEIVAYERAGLELQRSRPAGETAPPQWVPFRHDPLPLIAELARGRVPAAATSRHCHLVGSRGAGGIEWRLVDRPAAAAAGPPAVRAAG